MQQNIRDFELTEEFDDVEHEVDAVSVDKMNAIIESIECGIKPIPILEGSDLTPVTSSGEQQSAGKGIVPSNNSEGKKSSKDVATVNKGEVAKDVKPGIFEKMFPKIADRIKHIFRQMPESLDKLLSFYNMESHAKQIANKLNEQPDVYKTQSVHIDKNVIPSLVLLYNKATKDKVEMPDSETASNTSNTDEIKESEEKNDVAGKPEVIDAEVVKDEVKEKEQKSDELAGISGDESGNGGNDNTGASNSPNISNKQESNKPKDYTVKLPKGFNQPPSNLGERCTSMRLGYPMLNFGSETVKEMLKPANDIDFLKTLTKEFVKETKNTPIANALGTRTLLGQWKKIVKRVRECGRSKCIPVVHKPIKISGLDNVQALFQGMNGDNINKVFVTPINTRSSQITESLDSMNDDALFEGMIDWLKGGAGQKGDNSNMEADGLEVPIPYLAQFYEIRSPSTKQGLEQYTRYMSEETMKEICKNIGPEEVEAAKNHNELSFKAAILFEYVSKHDGILPYYILTQRRNPKEQLKVTPKPLLRDLYFVKSVDGPNKAVGYFVSKDERQQLFELG